MKYFKDAIGCISVDLNTLRARIAAQAQEAARRARNSNPVDTDT